MNEPGWLGCLRERRAIAERLCDEARKRADRLEAEVQRAVDRAKAAREAADKINPDHALTLVAAAMTELRGQHPEQEA